MKDYDRVKRRKQEVSERAAKPDPIHRYCHILGCHCPATAGTSKGLNRLYCRKHEDHFERHGSYHKKSYSAAEVNPHKQRALTWLTDNTGEKTVGQAIKKIETLYRIAGPDVEAYRQRGMKPKERARATWAKLREKRIDPRHPLAVWIAIEMITLDDPQSQRKLEYKRVQAAKIIHRIAGGSHKSWEQERSDGTIKIVELHKYPTSRGLVLRHIGEQLEKAAEDVAEYFLKNAVNAK